MQCVYVSAHASRYCEPCVGKKKGARDLGIQANGVAFDFHEIRPFFEVRPRPNRRREGDHEVARWHAFDGARFCVVILMHTLVNAHIECAIIVLKGDAFTMIGAF